MSWWRRLCRTPARCRGMLRGSMTAQIGLAVMVIAMLLVGGSSLLLMRLFKQDLSDIGDALMLGNLSLIQSELSSSYGDAPLVARALVDRIGAQIGGLHVAVVDEQRVTIAATPDFPLPPAWLPGPTVPDQVLPTRLTTDAVRALRERWGRLAVERKAPDGARYMVTMGRVWERRHGDDAPRPLGWAVLVLDTGIARELVIDGVQIVAGLLALSALVAALAGWWLARRIVDAARQLGDTAARIGARDLSERLEIRRLPTELRAAGEALNHMLDRLQAAFTRLQQFSSDLAHDLRTPLHNLLGEAQVALSRPRSAEEYRAVIESAVEDCERLMRLTESLLFLARADERQAVLQCEWVEVQDLAARLADYFEPLAEDRGLGLAIEVAPASAAALCVDRMMLIRALGNLMHNALRHARQGSTLRVLIAAGTGGSGRVAVANDGEPIPAELQSRVFERMFRVDAARCDSASGAGLGLAIVKSVMELHGGSVQLSSAPGQPTVFTLHFPPRTPASVSAAAAMPSGTA